MFSRINEFLKPFVVQKDAYAAGNPGRGGGNRHERKQPPFQEKVWRDKPVFDDADVALISTEAIRRLLQETADKKGLDQKLAILARLEQHAIKSIPVREGQSVWSALDDAGGFL